MQEDQEAVLDYLKCGVYEFNELKQWYRGNCELDAVLEDCVVSGKICQKVIRNKDNAFNIYWTPLKEDRHTATPTSTTPISRLPLSSKGRPLGVKRSGSLKFTSPFLPKRQKTSGDNSLPSVQKQLTYSTTNEETENKACDDEVRRTELIKQVEEKQEKLRRLKLVKLYKSKHDLDELKVLTNKWREVSQDAAQQLLDISNHPEKSMKRLLDCLNIDYNVIHYSEENDEFY